MIRFIIGVFLFAIAFTILFAWGYVKQQRKSKELLNVLFKKIESKIIRELKKHDYLTINEIINIIKDTKASLFWTRNKVKVTDPKLIANNILNMMVEKGIIVEVTNKRNKKYTLK